MRWWALAAILVSCSLTARAGLAAPTPPEMERPRLRLDESPSLPLLTPFRHPQRLRGTPAAAWRDGRYARWLQRSWTTLDWEAAFDGDVAGPEAPINPNVALSLKARPPELESEPPRWPAALAGDHWFQVVEPGDEPAARVEVSVAVVPPWLQRVDVHWAHALIALAGCGRGGTCSLGESFPADAFASLWDALSPREAPPPWWVCRARPVRVMRYGKEQRTLVLLDCDGSIPDGTLEELSLLARPPGATRPEALPPVPDPKAERGEWIDGVRLLHPRLLWVLHRVALAFPWKGIYIYSGYRPAADPYSSEHVSKHAFGHALDISVEGTSNEELLHLCHKLLEVGCGYYPNGPFIHVDIRAHDRALWVDASAPGEPSRYIDGWAGVVEGGRVVWEPPPRAR
jgi:hypothetical protein